MPDDPFFDRWVRNRLLDLGRRIEDRPYRPGGRPNQGSAAFLGKVVSGGAMPTAVDRVYLLEPVGHMTVPGGPAEGAVPTATWKPAPVPVVVIGGKAPDVGDRLHAWNLGGTWVAESRTVICDWPFLVSDCSSSPMPGAVIAASQGGVPVGSCTTGSDGRCTLSGLRTGSYDVVTTPPAGSGHATQVAVLAHSCPPATTPIHLAINPDHICFSPSDPTCGPCRFYPMAISLTAGFNVGGGALAPPMFLPSDGLAYNPGDSLWHGSATITDPSVGDTPCTGKYIAFCNAAGVMGLALRYDDHVICPSFDRGLGASRGVAGGDSCVPFHAVGIAAWPWTMDG